MKSKTLNNVIAEVVRIEYSEDSNDIYLVFEIKDEDFKKRIKENWMEDVELKIIGKTLYLNED